jgi:hypothetical protein
MCCCVEDEGVWPFGVALRGAASNHLMLRWLKTVVVSDAEKAQVDASGGDREDGAQTRCRGFAAEVSLEGKGTSKPE